MTKQIAQASLNNDSKPLDVMISLLKGLKSAWEEAMGKEHSKKVNRALA
jgi:flagellin-specific chaperone FliS